MRPFVKYSLWSLAGLLVLAGLAGGLVYLQVERSLPRLAGTIALPGLGAPVEVLRDGDGLVTIRAQSEADGSFALGYLHAQDRLWQMDFMRRTGTGRLSEVVGERTLALDRLMRGLDLGGLAEAHLAQLSPEALALVEAYSAGINAYIADPPGPWPPGFQLLGYAPEPWRPADSMVWGRLMALQLSDNWRQEVQRLKLDGRLPERVIDFLWPRVAPDSPITVTDPPKRLDPGPDPGEIVPWVWAPKRASNVWVLSGGRTTTGQPILANDPHLALSAPGLWYLARIETPDLTLAGATSPGVPFHLLGHNGQVAWGFTTTHADTQDLFIERIDPEQPDHYQTPNGTQAFQVRKDFIQVKGQEPVRVTYRSTRHGPVVSDLREPDDLSLPEDQVAALSWSALARDDRTAEALYRMNRAGDWHQFATTLKDFQSPVQNIAFADNRGHIGFATAGRIPIRKAGDGFAPVPGWSGEFDWIGWIAARRLPSMHDPAGGLIINANNRVVGPDYPFLLTSRWPNPARAERIAQILDPDAKSSLEASALLQQDSLSLGAQRLLPRLLTAMTESDQPLGPASTAALERLATWTGQMERARPEPLIFAAWVAALNRRLLAPHLGAQFGSFDQANLPRIERVLSERPIWCDDPRTPAGETCQEQIAGALDDALKALKRRFGSRLEAWTWGEAHQARFPHQLFSHLPLFDQIFGFGLATDGGSDTVNRAVPDLSGSSGARFTDIHGPGYRAIYDLADLDNSRFIIATGQSGNPLSPFWGNLATRWRDGDYLRLAAPPEDAPYRLMLTPQ